MQLPAVLFEMPLFATMVANLWHISSPQNHWGTPLITWVWVLAHILPTHRRLVAVVGWAMLLVVVYTRLIVLLRWLWATLPHQTGISSLCKEDCILKGFWPRHHYPLLLGWFEAMQKQMHCHIIIHPHAGELKLQAPELSSECRDAGCLSQVEKLCTQLHIAINITKLLLYSVHQNIKGKVVKCAQVIPTITAPPSQCIPTEKAHKKPTSPISIP